MLAVRLPRGDDFFLRLLDGGGVPTPALHVSNGISHPRKKAWSKFQEKVRPESQEQTRESLASQSPATMGFK